MVEFSCGFCGGQVADDLRCTRCGHQFVNGKHKKKTNGALREYLGYRGRLGDSYEQESFDYEHEGYRERDL